MPWPLQWSRDPLPNLSPILRKPLEPKLSHERGVEFAALRRYVSATSDPSKG
jgi:hypothetical protein